MNTCTEKLSSVFEVVKSEAYEIKRHTQKRFKDITSWVNECKSDPKQAYPLLLGCAYILTVAWISQSIVIPILIFSIAIAFTIIADYLDNTYVYPTYSRSTSSVSLWRLLSTLDYQQKFDPQPLFTQPSDEERREREEMRNNPEEAELVNALERIEDHLKKAEQERLKKLEAEKNDTRPVFLFLRAKADHNGAFDLYSLDQKITINGDNDEGVRKLQEKYRIILINNITSVDQIKEGLEKITKKIAHVWISAHGTPTSMLLDGCNRIKNNEIDSLLPIMQEKLRPDAHVVLDSCSTGGVAGEGGNIATRFSKNLPGRTIWAPKLESCTATLDLGEDFSAEVKMYGRISRLDFLKEKVWNICSLSPFKKMEVESNIAVQFKNGEECLGAT